MGCESRENRTDLGRSLHSRSDRGTLRGADPQDQAEPEPEGAFLPEQGGERVRVCVGHSGGRWSESFPGQPTLTC